MTIRDAQYVIQSIKLFLLKIKVQILNVSISCMMFDNKSILFQEEQLFGKVFVNM